LSFSAKNHSELFIGSLENIVSAVPGKSRRQIFDSVRYGGFIPGVEEYFVLDEGIDIDQTAAVINYRVRIGGSCFRIGRNRRGRACTSRKRAA
jgi:hypothetical protein